MILRISSDRKHAAIVYLLGFAQSRSRYCQIYLESRKLILMPTICKGLEHVIDTLL